MSMGPSTGRGTTPTPTIVPSTSQRSVRKRSAYIRRPSSTFTQPAATRGRRSTPARRPTVPVVQTPSASDLSEEEPTAEEIEMIIPHPANSRQTRDLIRLTPNSSYRAAANETIDQPRLGLATIEAGDGMVGIEESADLERVVLEDASRMEAGDVMVGIEESEHLERVVLEDFPQIEAGDQVAGIAEHLENQTVTEDAHIEDQEELIETVEPIIGDETTAQGADVNLNRLHVPETDEQRRARLDSGIVFCLRFGQATQELSGQFTGSCQ
jgi:hypothetical protein